MFKDENRTMYQFPKNSLFKIFIEKYMHIYTYIIITYQMPRNTLKMCTCNYSNHVQLISYYTLYLMFKEENISTLTVRKKI